MNIGNLVTAKRQEMGLTRIELSKMIGKTDTIIAWIEKYSFLYSTATTQSIIDVLDITQCEWNCAVNNTYIETVGEALVFIQDSRGKTNDEMAKIIGIKSATYRCIKLDKYPLNASMKSKLNRAFGINFCNENVVRIPLAESIHNRLQLIPETNGDGSNDGISTMKRIHIGINELLKDEKISKRNMKKIYVLFGGTVIDGVVEGIVRKINHQLCESAKYSIQSTITTANETTVIVDEFSKMINVNISINDLSIDDK